MTRGYVVDWPEARRRRNAPNARWDSIIEEFDGEVWPELTPSFSIRPGDVVFTIGSCFARNIEAHLDALGCQVPMLSLDFPTEELNGQPRSAMNRFHPPAFRQCLEWTAAIHDRDGRVTWADCEPMAIQCSKAPDETFFDMDMAGAIPVSRERFIERRQHIYEVFATVFSAACMMMTPGVVEAFRDKQTGLYLFGAPTNKAMLAQPDRWEYEALSYEQCLQDMLAAIDVVRARNPGVKVLVTTSPVPLGVTFSGRDVRIANSYSKSVLRAVCDVVATRRPLVDYFPSFETVTLSAPHLAWRPDRLHVTQRLISKIVSRMIDRYVEDVPPAARFHHAALVALSDGDGEAAAAAAREALALEPGHADARLALSDALYAQQDWPGAEAAALEVHRLEPERAEVPFRLARILGPQNRYEEAVRWMAKGLRLPGVIQHDVTSVAKVLARAPAEPAAPVARRMVEMFPTHVEVYGPLIQLLMRAGLAAEAETVTRKALSLSKPPPVLRVWLAEQLLAAGGDLQEAQAQLDRVLQADPAHPEALRLKARIEEASLTPAG
jgi:tetratricopeptide (TPR) repeat protein